MVQPFSIWWQFTKLLLLHCFIVFLWFPLGTFSTIFPTSSNLSIFLVVYTFVIQFNLQVSCSSTSPAAVSALNFILKGLASFFYMVPSHTFSSLPHSNSCLLHWFPLLYLILLLSSYSSLVTSHSFHVPTNHYTLIPLYDTPCYFFPAKFFTTFILSKFTFFWTFCYSTISLIYSFLCYSSFTYTVWAGFTIFGNLGIFLYIFTSIFLILHLSSSFSQLSLITSSLDSFSFLLIS